MFLCTSARVGVYLAASVFGELWKLEPLAPQKKVNVAPGDGVNFMCE